MATVPAIKVQKLTKRFESKVALANVSFSVSKGDIVGFLGPNGAGKTTAIRCIMDFIRPTSGTIKINGKDVRTNVTELKKIIGFLPSDMQLNPSWSSDDHLEIVEKIQGGKTETNKLIELLGLDTKAKVKNLSTGNKQKLSIILAFAGRPKILIMDEPTKGLDPVLQNTIYDMLTDFTKQGNTVFFSSHNLAEVQRICDTVILIKDGKVVTEQSMKEIRGKKTHIINAMTQNRFTRNHLVRLGAEIISLEGNRVEMKVRGDLNPILQYLTSLHLLDLDVGHVSLEDLFLELYKD